MSRVEDPPSVAKCWSYTASPDMSASAVAGGSSIYFLDTDRRLQALDITSGAKLWTTELGGMVVSDLLVSGASVFVVTSSKASGADDQTGRLWSISTQTGITNWVIDVTFGDRVFLGVLNGSVVSVRPSGDVETFARENGASLWAKDLGVAIVSPPAFERGALTVVTAGSEVLRIGEKGDLTRLVKLDHAPTAVVSHPGIGTLVGDDRGNLVFISSGERRVWSFKNGGRISHILPFDSEFIVASDDNFIYKLNRHGHVEWKRRLSGRTAGNPLLTGNLFVASVVGEGDVYVIDARNGKVLNRIEVGDGISAEVSSTVDQRGFTVLHPQGLIRYSEDGCSTK